jgi:hypothetical protein
MKRLRIVALVAGGLSLIAGFTATAVTGEGEGHTPVTLCHWVPAHDGSTVLITVDDDGSSGNTNLEAHVGHENDIIPAPEGGCPPPGGED